MPTWPHGAHPHAIVAFARDPPVLAVVIQPGRHGNRQRRCGLPVWVIDLDVHQGNGTAALFADDPTVFTLSLHGERNFPFRKVAGDLDIDLPDGCTDAPYLDALSRAMERSWQGMQAAGRTPGLAFYLAGADAHEGDRLGRLKLTDAGMAERDRQVLGFLRRQGVPVALVMAGGYGHDIHTTVAVQFQTIQMAWQAWQAWQALQAGRTEA